MSDVFNQQAFAMEPTARMAFYRSSMMEIFEAYITTANSLMTGAKDEFGLYIASTETSQHMDSMLITVTEMDSRATAARVVANASIQKSRAAVGKKIGVVLPSNDESKEEPGRTGPPPDLIVANEPVKPMPQSMQSIQIIKRQPPQTLTMAQRLVAAHGLPPIKPVAANPPLVTLVTSDKFVQLVVNAGRYTAGPSEFVNDSQRKYKIEHCNAGRSCPGANCTYYHDPAIHNNGDPIRKLYVRWVSQQMNGILASDESVRRAWHNGEITNEYIRDVGAIAGAFLCRFLKMIQYKEA